MCACCVCTTLALALCQCLEQVRLGARMVSRGHRMDGQLSCPPPPLPHLLYWMQILDVHERKAMMLLRTTRPNPDVHAAFHARTHARSHPRHTHTRTNTHIHFLSFIHTCMYSCYASTICRPRTFGKSRRLAPVYGLG